MKFKLISVRGLDGIGYDHTLKGYDEENHGFMGDEILREVLTKIPDYQRTINFYKQVNEGQLATSRLTSIESELEID